MGASSQFVLGSPPFHLKGVTPLLGCPPHSEVYIHSRGPQCCRDEVSSIFGVTPPHLRTASPPFWGPAPTAPPDFGIPPDTFEVPRVNFGSPPSTLGFPPTDQLPSQPLFWGPLRAFRASLGYFGCPPHFGALEAPLQQPLPQLRPPVPAHPQGPRHLVHLHPRLRPPQPPQKLLQVPRQRLGGETGGSASRK